MAQNAACGPLARRLQNVRSPRSEDLAVLPREEVAEALRSNTFETPTGTLSFNEKGDLKDFNFVVYEWHADATKTPMTK